MDKIHVIEAENCEKRFLYVIRLISVHYIYALRSTRSLGRKNCLQVIPEVVGLVERPEFSNKFVAFPVFLTETVQGCILLQPLCCISIALSRRLRDEVDLFNFKPVSGHGRSSSFPLSTRFPQLVKSEFPDEVLLSLRRKNIGCIFKVAGRLCTGQLTRQNGGSCMPFAARCSTWRRAWRKSTRNESSGSCEMVEDEFVPSRGIVTAERWATDDSLFLRKVSVGWLMR